MSSRIASRSAASSGEIVAWDVMAGRLGKLFDTCIKTCWRGMVQAGGERPPALSDSRPSGGYGTIWERSAMADRTDTRITRTARAFEQAVVELASQRPVSQITVAELADRAGMTRATFYNRYNSPLGLLIHVLDTDLERGHRAEDARRAEGRYSAAEMLRLATADVADHVERFLAVYRHALHDPADGGVYETLVRHFADYSVAFIARSTHPGLPDANYQVIAQFVGEVAYQRLV